MGRVLGAYLAKEWRDQRATLAWLLGTLVAATLLGVLLLPAKPSFFEPVLLCALGLATVAFLATVGSDLLPGEVARGTGRSLERVPAGLGTAFLAKLVLFLLAGALTALLGLALTLALACGPSTLPGTKYAAGAIFPRFPATNRSEQDPPSQGGPCPWGDTFASTNRMAGTT
ncbi:MAG: hypothetical protein AB1726_05455 [Planctomycetota bacterium]